MEQQNVAVDGWTVDKEHDNAVFFTNDSDGAQVSVETFDRRNSLANYQVKSQYQCVAEAMGRVRSCETFEGAIESAKDYMTERA